MASQYLLRQFSVELRWHLITTCRFGRNEASAGFPCPCRLLQACLQPSCAQQYPEKGPRELEGPQVLKQPMTNGEC